MALARTNWDGKLRLIAEHVMAYFETSFEREYLEHIRQPVVVDIINRFIGISDYCDVIFMCIEDTPDRCHRRLLAEECLRIDPHLQIEIK